ncbi:MAG: glycosyltransferase family 1 protein [SAR324 cluster bacterium]|uniref:Glycosyltransferase family 1 protein n=1 Tax=SAR324 cluster bacterium TaxID=2024889 RepID=A0A7X9FU46_9DELT|nr:glycosyltransferase family 1 protein [SAR324 cluster bacterium]
MDKKLRIAILGTRGIPARYGGFETFAEELSLRLVKRGHEVTVFGRRPFFSSVQETLEYKGVKIQYVPTIFHKYLETPLHGLSSFIAASKRDFDVILLCNAANSPFSWILNLKGLPFAVNVDGIERKRAKWNSLGKLWYRLGERSSVLFAKQLIADAKVIRDYYKEKYSCEAVVIPYGASPIRRDTGKTLQNFGLKAGQYLLYVSRLEPENNALGVVQAYNDSGVTIPLVVVGEAPYAKEYIEQVKEAAGKGVIFAGFQFAEAYQELQSNCYLYIQATEVGGTHPALVEKR